jgi:two-component system chemotaxis response regulator CheB
VPLLDGGDAATTVVAIGGSAGSLGVLRAILKTLPTTLEAAVLVTLHTAREGPGHTAEVLQRATSLRVAYPLGLEPLRNGCVYVAPPDHHLHITHHCAEATRAAEEHHTRPSVDVLFRSAAIDYDRHVIAILLSGAGNDGSAGLLAVRAGGGVVIVQAPEDAAFDGMPRRAIHLMTPDYVLPAVLIGAAVQRLLGDAGRTVGKNGEPTSSRRRDTG